MWVCIYVYYSERHTTHTHTNTCNLELKKNLKQTAVFWKAEQPP